MKILVASPINAEAMNELGQQHVVVNAVHESEEKLKTLILDCDVLVFRSGVKISAELMDDAPNLKLLVRAGSGLDNLDLPYVKNRGLELVRIPQPGAQAVAEMAFAFMLTLSRNLFEADRSMRESRWIKYELEGYLLQNKTLGIVGVGNIGSRVAEIAVALEMNVIGCVEHPCPDREHEYLEKGIFLLDFDQVVSQADYLCIHVPLKDTTRNLIDADVLSKMKTGSYLINLARGGVVDEQALLDELTNNRRLRGAALDVHQREGAGNLSPLAHLTNVILTPHIGAMAIDAQREIGRRAIEIINGYAERNGSVSATESLFSIG